MVLWSIVDELHACMLLMPFIIFAESLDSPLVVCRVLGTFTRSACMGERKD